MSRWISDYDPEDETFWLRKGKRIARRNLFWSIVAENLGFSVWLVWSVVAANLPKAGFRYTTDELFLLVALPGLVGAIMRFPYTFAVPRFGGRNWTVFSALALLVPTLALAALVKRPSTPLWMMAIAACSAGLGGGNFASSMANISFFFPDREKGLALGINAAGGNIGVSNVQFVVPLVIGMGGWGLANAGLLWVPFIVIAAAGAWAHMDNLTSASSSFTEQLAVAKEKHTWVIAVLYIGTFGSFVGYSAAFPLLLKTQFPSVGANFAFTGALVGSIARPLGGKLADCLGGARVTLWNFVLMAAATIAVLISLRGGSFPGFVAAFLVLFVTTGIGNGSTFRMVPAIFRAEHMWNAHREEERALALRAARREGAAVLGLSSAIGALGGYFIPRSFGASIAATGGPQAALTMFLFFYAICIATTWWFYVRTTLFAKRAPSLARANV
jgi:NNP family nitrate/nitrite transporter-like MFS transporter